MAPHLEIGLLGPLEVRYDGEDVALGGAKQRALLAILLLRAGTVVTIERLIDDVWGDNPPPSAAHSLEAYVSRLRQLLGSRGLSLTRRGAGYCLELEDAVVLDVRRFEPLAADVSLAAAIGDHRRVSELAAEALALWRGPALADVALASPGRADAERLEELRLRLLEQRFDAELALGRHEQLLVELQVLVGQNPYRERFVGQLMLALYRSGRQADALEAYERTRVALDDDLGLQPSAELRQLSGQIVRQEPALRRPPVVHDHGPIRAAVESRARRVGSLVLVGAATAAAVALTAEGSAPTVLHPPPAPDRVAIVLPQTGATLDRAAANLSSGMRGARALFELKTETFVVDSRRPAAARVRVARQVAASGAGLVVVLGDGPVAQALVPDVRARPDLRFLFMDASLRELGLVGAPNAAAVRFSDEEATHLVGYMSGLSERRGESSAPVDTVSVVAGQPTPDTRRLVAAFVGGVRHANRDVAVRIDYSGEVDDPTACERIANRHIDAGADVVFAVAGRCGLGALAVARYRGVWGVGSEDDGVTESQALLASTYKEWGQATRRAFTALADGSLEMGRDVVLGLDDEYAVGVWLTTEQPVSVQSAVIDRCSEIRAGGAL
jgi:DNA-binding SARP family transcriptional activator/basic membrane lipoprotein Med (substrate-binding protein (PBP1-ABC) superfamily)